MAGVLLPGPDAGVTSACTKLIAKNTEKLTKAEDYAGWVPKFLMLLSVTCVQGWAIAYK